MPLCAILPFSLLRVRSEYWKLLPPPLEINANGNDKGLVITPIVLEAFPVLNPEFIVPAKPKATISSVLTLNGIVPFCEERHGFTKSNSFVEQALIPKRLGSPVGLIVSAMPKCSSCMFDSLSIPNGP